MSGRPNAGRRRGVPLDVLAFRCNEAGTIEEVVANDLDLGREITVGQSMFEIIDPHSHEKARRFLSVVASRQAATGWELNLVGQSQPFHAVFTGTRQNDQIYVIAGRSAGDIETIIETLEQINNEQLNQFRMAFRDQQESLQLRERKSLSSYEELSRLNNELANAQRELTRKSNQLARLNEEKNRILGIAAHDLRNPLTVIRGYAEFLRSDPEDLSPERKRAYEEIAASSRFMLDLINDLLDVSQIEGGRRELRITTFDGMAVVRRCVERLKAQAAAKQIQISLAAGDHEIPLTQDTGKLEQICTNVVGNAVKFSPAGSTVEVTATPSDEELLITVRDQGIGIPADQLESIFEPFVHLSGTGTAGERSTGLGLSIVAELVTLLGGRIQVQSELGAGSTFQITIPRVVSSASR